MTLEPPAFEPEDCEELPRGIQNLTRFMHTYARDHQLTRSQSAWFLEQLRNNLPLYFIFLWQGYPEWPLFRDTFENLNIQFQVSTDALSPRYLAVKIKGDVVANTKLV